MILFIQTAFLGDLLLSTPVLKKLKDIYPDKKLHVLCRKGLGSFLTSEGFADRVFDDFKGTKPTLAEIRERFGDSRYELLICAHESWRSNFISAFIKADKKIGFKNFWNGWIYDERIERHLPWPEVLRQMELLSVLDKNLAESLAQFKGARAPFHEIPDWSRMDLRRHIEESYGKKIIAMAPGSVWPTKRWNQFGDLAGELLKEGYDVVLLGSPSEKNISAQIKAQHPEVRDLTGSTSIPQMFEVLRDCDLLVCNDSGAMHMASLIGLPTVSFFGPTVQEFGYQPWNAQAVVVENTQLQCRPCSSHGTEKCPIGTHECMTSITVDRVMDEIRARLS